MAEHSSASKKGPMAQVQHTWHVILKWKWTGLTFFLAVFLAATLFSFLVKPVYTATGVVWIEDDPKILPFEEVQALGSGSSLQTHARLLQSRALADAVIDKLKLYDRPEFAKMPGKKDNPSDPADPLFRERLIQEVLACVSVAPVGGTRLVDVKCKNPNPRLAADMLNALFDAFIDMIVKKRYQASELASEFLNTQIASLRSEIAEREKKLSEVGTEKDILPLTAAETPTVTRLAEVNKNLTDATIDRINKFNYYNQVKSAPLGEIPDTQPGSLIQKLREQYQNFSREYAKRLTTLRPEYPEMQNLKSELDAAQDALQAEMRNIVASAYADYQAALKREASYQNLLDGLRNEAIKSNSNSVIYNSLRIEIAQKKNLLETLTKRQNETDVSARLKDLEAINVWIVDRADYPLRPSSPNKKKNILLGFLVGLMGGIGLALGLEYLNPTVKTSDDVASATGLATLGTIPSFETETKAAGPRGEFTKILDMVRGGSRVKNKEKKPGRRDIGENTGLARPPAPGYKNPENPENRIELIASRLPYSIQAESYRSIRTTLLVSAPPGRIKSIIFTSPLAGEGKSSTVSNLGASLASANLRVVIVDSDLRKPRQRRIFSQDNGPGLTQYLSSQLDPADMVMPTQIPNLGLIVSGPPPINPLELLSSEKMDSLVAFLKKSYDYILFDTPPILAVSDALALGPMSDGVILVSRGSRTPMQALKQAKQKLDTHKIKCLGVILNGVNLIEQDGYYSRQYSHYYRSD